MCFGGFMYSTEIVAVFKTRVLSQPGRLKTTLKHNVGGSVAEWSACWTRNPAVPGSSPALTTTPGFVSW